MLVTLRLAWALGQEPRAHQPATSLMKFPKKFTKLKTLGRNTHAESQVAQGLVGGCSFSGVLEATVQELHGAQQFGTESRPSSTFPGGPWMYRDRTQNEKRRSVSRQSIIGVDTSGFSVGKEGTDPCSSSHKTHKLQS